MGNIASVHLEKGHVGEFFHNDRSKPTTNSIFKENRVVTNRTAKEAIELYNKLLDERTKKYVERTGRKLQKKTQTLLSVVVNIKENTTLEELEKLANKFEEEFGATPLQIAIHRDEGYIDEDGNKHINHHAHIMLMGLDKDGYSVKRKIKTRHFRAMQDWAAEILQMKRGRSARETKRKRLDTYEYKEAMRLKNQEVIELKKKLIEKDNEIQELKITKKDLEEQIKQLRERMKNFNKELEGREGKEKEFTQEDYKALGEIKKLLKAKDLVEVKEKLESFESEIKQRIMKRQKKLIEKYTEERGLLDRKEVIQKDIALKIVNTTCKSEKVSIVGILEENEKLKKENELLKEENQKLKNTIEKMKDKFAELKQVANKVIKAKISYFKKLYDITKAELVQYYKKEQKLYTELNKREERIEKEVEREVGINPKKRVKIDIDF